MHREYRNQPRYSTTGDLYTVLASGEDTGGAFCVVEAIIPPGSGPPLHTHTREDEFFVITEGQITFTVAGKTIVAHGRGGVGDSVFAPRGIPHRFENTGSVPARMIVTATPAGFDRMLQAISVELPPGATQPAPVTEAMMARVLAECPKFGVIVHV